jgi:D-alanine transaminase
MSQLACWNSRIMPLDQVCIPATDRGYLFGDSIYEVIRIYNGRSFLLQAHLERLAWCLAQLDIAVDLDQISSDLNNLVSQGKPDEAIIYIQISRGAGPRSHAPTELSTPNCLMFLQDYPRAPVLARRQQGITVGLIADERHQLCQIKTTNLLANTRAMTQAKDQGSGEALLVDPAGHVLEGTHSSFAIVHGGEIQITPLTANILPGITRRHILQLATSPLNIPIREQMLDRKTVLAADEAMLLGTTTEVMPVVAIEGHPIGRGKPGLVTQRLAAAFDESVATS